MGISFDKMNEECNNLLIVDALSLAFRWKHIGATDFYEDYLNTINSFKKSYKAKFVIVCADQGSSSYRKNLLPEYKANRKEKFAQQTESEKLEFEQFFKDFQISLEHIRTSTKYPVIQFKNTEADDIAAYIVRKIKKLPLEHTWLLSTDADWDLLLRNNVSRFSYVTRKEISLDNWDANHEYEHHHHLSVKCLMGDIGDNVKGVPGVGPKRAVSLIEQYGSALDVADAIPIQSHLKFIKNLNESKDIIKLNYLLMDLESFCDEALGDNTKEIDKVLLEYIMQSGEL